MKYLNKELKLKCLVKGYKGTYFKIGQVWETREGDKLKVKDFYFKTDSYKLALTKNNSEKELYYTLKGEYVKGKESDFDLIKLISTEVQTESTPTEDIQSKTRINMSKKLKKYRLHFVKTECYYADVEAESLDDAIDMAEDIESGQMEAIDDTLHFEFDRDFTMNTNTNKGIKQ